jgi:hypothetical protein
MKFEELTVDLGRWSPEHSVRHEIIEVAANLFDTVNIDLGSFKLWSGAT